MAIVLTRDNLSQLLTMTDVIEAVENGFSEYKTGHCFVPVRMPVRIEKEDGLFLFMPAYLEKGGSFGTKIISVFPGNLKKGLSTLQAAYLLSDPTSGELLALMEGTILTAMRTGAASAVATKYLACAASSVLGIIGTGVQALFQVEGICAVRPIKKVLAYDKSTHSVERFLEAISRNLDVSVEVMGLPQEVVIDSDIVVTVTTSAEPVFHGKDLKPGTHINAVGAYTPEMREVDGDTVKRALIVVDTYEGCMAEAGDLLIPMKAGELSKEQIHADLGEIVLGRKPGRTTETQITLFESVGFALEDLVTARLAYQRAKEQGVGTEFQLADSP